MKNNILLSIFFMLGMVSHLFAQDDRAVFDLKGNVRLCVPEVADNGFAFPSMRAEFSDKGTLVSLDGMDMTVKNGSYTVKRDASGRIVRLEFSAGDADRINTFSYDGQGRVCEVKDYYVNVDTDEETLDTRMVRTYNADGLPGKEIYYNEDGSERAVYTYTYTKTDADGNWLARSVSEASQGMEGISETRELSAGEPAEGKVPATGVSGSPASGYDDALSAALADKRSAGKSSGSRFWEILWGVLFLLLFAHSIYVLYVKRPEFSRLPDSDAGDTAEEERLADMLHAAVEGNVTSFRSAGIDDAAPVTGQQVKNIKDAMRQVLAASPRGTRVVNTYNAAVDMMTGCEERVFTGSKAYLVLGGIVVGIIAVMRISDGHVIQGIAYFLFSFGAYLLGSRRQLYRVAAELRSPAGTKATTSAILAIFGFMASSKTYITKYYRNGSEQRHLQETDHSEHVMFGVLGFFALAFLGMLMPFVGLFNYLRFYVMER
ncbi:MAG: hypothetical protein NC344_08130 [Bacteroidales bacterium]|nr:hypothetical protein [Bacteroidales bacterium]MCM1147782.1 hypothetical protein [Bacteroidales bacterium]MCM1206608.1 hypothetical protein [Bacillota bacterium]MCM1510651.1 hypothetical protein [Clostridium sp.]